jgi:hypothetical protein
MGSPVRRLPENSLSKKISPGRPPKGGLGALPPFGYQSTRAHPAPAPLILLIIKLKAHRFLTVSSVTAFRIESNNPARDLSITSRSKSFESREKTETLTGTAVA